MNLSTLRQYQDVAFLLLRIAVGVIFVVAGWGKLTGIEGFQGLLTTIGVPAAGIMAWVIAVIEFVGGLMVLLGLYIRIPAILLACVMIVAIFTVKMPEGFDPMRLDLSLLMMNLALAIVGSGRYSVDYALAGGGEPAGGGRAKVA